jgi:hypothetical protein
VHKDKLTRTLPLLARAEQGKVVLVRGNWVQPFLDEICAFPEGQHDDMVDAAASALTMLSSPTGAFDSASIRTARLGQGERLDVARLRLSEL